MRFLIEKLKFIIKSNIYLIHLSHKIISMFGINFEEEYTISSLLKKNDVVIDIGAHLGESIIGFRRYNKDIKIYSFEPNPKIFSKLKKKFINKKNIVLNNYLLMNSNGLADFYVPKIKGISLPYMGSFNKDYIIQRFNHFFFFSIDKKLYWESYKIESKKLDEFNLRPKIIKIDTEGSELEVLKGSKETILSFSPLIIVEFNHNNYKGIYEYLSKFEYKLFRFDKNSFRSMDYEELLDYEKFKNQRNLIFRKVYTSKHI